MPRRKDNEPRLSPEGQKLALDCERKEHAALVDRLIDQRDGLATALGEIQSLLYSADNAAEVEMKTRCIRKAFGVAGDALATAKRKERDH
jgi:hypothetical protein